MTDPLEQVVAPTAIERAMMVFEQLKAGQGQSERTRARKVIHEHVYRLIATAVSDERRLVVAALAQLNSLQKQNAK
jgi:hypothetical protein